MLLNLTQASFTKFGRIESAGFEQATASIPMAHVRQTEVTDKVVRRLFMNKRSATVLDILDGTAILFIGADAADLDTFLLDKTVVIDSGIFYYVTPLISTAVISTAYQYEPDIIAVEPHNRPAGITPQISPSVVHTLFFHEKEVNFVFKGESHPFWELTYVDSGALSNKIGDMEYVMSTGSIMLCLPNRFHSQSAADSGHVRYLTATFDMEFCEPELFDGIVFEADDYLKNLLSAIITENRGSMIYSDDLILCYLKELIIALIRIRKIERCLKISHPAVRKTMENKIAAQAAEYVRNHLNKPLTVQEIARSIPVSESYLSTVFRRSTGGSLSRYISELKLEHAKELLLTGRFSVTEIAEALGYSNVHYFSTQFKKVFLITPTQYADSILK
ncbi:MAG: helix-turn-helix domain-containing protein [Saccharofermentanales bacterium]